MGLTHLRKNKRVISSSFGKREYRTLVDAHGTIHVMAVPKRRLKTVFGPLFLAVVLIFGMCLIVGVFEPGEALVQAPFATAHILWEAG